jgi:hypothetical protein
MRRNQGWILETAKKRVRELQALRISVPWL